MVTKKVSHYRLTMANAIPMSDGLHILDCIATSTVTLPESRKHFLAQVIMNRMEVRNNEDSNLIERYAREKFGLESHG